MKTSHTIILILAAVSLSSPAVGANPEASGPGMAPWCTNDPALATKDRIYDPKCPGAEVKRNPDGTWGTARPDGAKSGTGVQPSPPPPRGSERPAPDASRGAPE